MITALNLTNVLFDVNGLRESPLTPAQDSLAGLDRTHCASRSPPGSRLVDPCVSLVLSLTISPIYHKNEGDSVSVQTMPTPEDRARENIDRLLTQAGWAVRDQSDANILAYPGVAIRNFTLKPGHGFADYLLYADGRAAGVIEAKKEGVTLTGVETQSERYTKGLPDGLPAWSKPLPFSYESTGIETRFTNGLDPEPRSRPVFSFHKPETLAQWLDIGPRLQAADRAADYGKRTGTFLARIQHMPPLIDDLWPPKPQAIMNLEQSLR
jgi:type I restriction enzyme, R subunit